jgi:hypothetical protein
MVAMSTSHQKEKDREWGRLLVWDEVAVYTMVRDAGYGCLNAVCAECCVIVGMLFGFSESQS